MQGNREPGAQTLKASTVPPIGEGRGRQEVYLPQRCVDVLVRGVGWKDCDGVGMVVVSRFVSSRRLVTVGDAVENARDIQVTVARRGQEYLTSAVDDQGQSNL